VYDKKKLMQAVQLSDAEKRGRALWLQRCAFCHDGLGQPTYKTMGSWIGAPTVKTLGEDGIRGFILNGTEHMPSFRYGLQSQQIDDLLAFLKTVPADQQPTPSQLAGKIAGKGNEE
jgi:mono/diheme cytochrome c family protein